MKIYYDYQIFSLQKFGGISRYYCELIKHLNEQNNVFAKTKCFNSRNDYYKKWIGNIFIDNKYISKVANVLNRAYTFFVSNKYDIIHPTYYSPYIFKLKKKIVITVYDMIHEKFSDISSADPKVIINKKEAIYKSDHIIAISENTKKDILSIYPDIPSDKISVIYIGSDFVKREIIDSSIKNIFPKKYILYTGNRNYYKNFAFFFNSIKNLLIEDKELYLVCVGGNEFDEVEKEMFSDVSKKVVYIKPSDDIFIYAYSNALCFVFPTQYEGFGIPTLEAFACDCPAIISNVSSMPEVGGDAVLYIDPYDKDDIYQKVKTLIYDDSLRNELIKKGRLQLTKFSWEIISKQIVNCYSSIKKKGS